MLLFVRVCGGLKGVVVMTVGECMVLVATIIELDRAIHV